MVPTELPELDFPSHPAATAARANMGIKYLLPQGLVLVFMDLGIQ